jgi:hypothetical protein
MRLTKWAAALAAAAVLAVGSCAGVRARDEMMPLARAMWAGVRPDVVLGGEGSLIVAQEAADLDAALEAEDRLALRGVDWPVLDAAAQRGIERRVQHEIISPGVGAILVDRVAALGELITKLKERAQ